MMIIKSAAGGTAWRMLAAVVPAARVVAPPADVPAGTPSAAVKELTWIALTFTDAPVAWIAVLKAVVKVALNVAVSLDAVFTFAETAACFAAGALNS